MTLVPWSDEELDIENCWRRKHDLDPINPTVVFGESFADHWDNEEGSVS